MGLFSRLFSVVPRVLGGLFGGGRGRTFANMAVDKAKELALQKAKQLAAEKAAEAVKSVAERTGVQNLIGQDLVNQGASLARNETEKQVGNFFQK